MSYRNQYGATTPFSDHALSATPLRLPAYSLADWTALISSHAARRHALPDHALYLFCSIRRAGVPPDKMTIISLLTATAHVADPAVGVSAHVLLLKLGLPFTAPATNAAIDMYAKWCKMSDARQLFDEMHTPIVVSWTVILAGTLRLEGIRSGQEVFDRMPHKNQISWTVMIAACVDIVFSGNLERPVQWSVKLPHGG